MLAKQVLWVLNTNVKVEQIGCMGWGRPKRFARSMQLREVERRQLVQAREGPRGGGGVGGCLCRGEEGFCFLITEEYLGKSVILGKAGAI